MKHTALDIIVFSDTSYWSGMTIKYYNTLLNFFFYFFRIIIIILNARCAKHCAYCLLIQAHSLEIHTNSHRFPHQYFIFTMFCSNVYKLQGKWFVLKVTNQSNGCVLSFHIQSKKVCCIWCCWGPDFTNIRLQISHIQL